MENEEPDGWMKRYAPNKLPARITRSMWVVYDTQSGNIDIIQYDPTKSSHSREKIVLRQLSVEVDLPVDIDLVGQAVAQLRENEKDILAEFHQKLEGVRGKIQNLLCIEHKPEQAQDAGDDARA